MPTGQAGTRLVADIGGTNTRIALFDPHTRAFRALREYLNRDFPGLAEVIQEWLSSLEESAPQAACIAAAAYHADDQLCMVNCDWRFSRSDLARRFGWRQSAWLNDFEANAHALPYLDGDAALALHPGNAAQTGKLAVVGPGTGFGGATLLRHGGRAIASSAEPGHMGLSPGSELESDLFRYLLREHPDIYVELLVSGPGLVRIYRTLCQLEGHVSEDLHPREVAKKGVLGEDIQCARALEIFCGLFGSACGDFVLANGTWEGIYLAGGIASKIADFLRNSSFFTRLQSKGAMSGHLATVPVYLITDSHPGLLGAAHAPLGP